MIGIYKITSPTGKIYIGQSWNIKKRLKDYSYVKCFLQVKLFNSLKAYGFENHKLETICELPNDTTQEILDEKEIFYWKFYKEEGFELLNIKEPGRGGRHSEETKKKISQQLMGINHPMYGKKQPLEFIKKRTQKNIGQKRTYETKLKMSKVRVGMKFTEQHKLNLSNPVVQLSLNGEFIKQWNSLKEAENILNISNISRACRFQHKTAGGFKWRYFILPT